MICFERVRRRDSRGFTLIELLVVIAIIGVLSSVVMTSLNSARIKARDAKRASDIRQLQTALELYYHDHSVYPPAPTGNLVSNLPISDYISSIPSEPLFTATNDQYRYRRGGTGVAGTDPHSYTILIRTERLGFCQISVPPGNNGWVTFQRCTF
jgi:prepilin-type N-terminal cleavage/methylation domain-containing protein